MANIYTPGLKLRQPAQGDDYWDDDNNANAAILEATLGRGSGYAGVIGSGLAVSDGGGLSAAYTAGSCRVNGTLRTITSGAKTCADNALNFIYVDSAGAVQAATSLPSPPYAALALVETSGGAIVRIGDLRRRMVDGLAEHTEAGAHGQITPSRVSPSGTDGAYKRSACAAYQSPESQVNNIVLKSDPTLLISLSGKNQGYTADYIVSELGSGFVPVDANGIILGCHVWGSSTYIITWRFYPPGESNENIRWTAAVGSHGSHDVYGTVVARLSSDGRLRVNCWAALANSGYLEARLVGWIEPA